MPHDRDHDHPAPHLPTATRAKVLPLVSRTKPDRPRPDHPAVTPRAPVDPRPHPSRRLATASLRARPR